MQSKSLRLARPGTLSGRTAAVTAVVAGLLLTGLPAPAEAGTVYQASLRTAARSLRVASEVNVGYDRTKYFGSWKDANGDCQNTRAEVLLAETKSTASYTTSRRCTVARGKWVTNWDNRTYYSASDVQIDHLVPVHEAWGSGARYWSQARRIAFFNDLSDYRSLNAQTSALNASKGASGPEKWMPPKNRCRYIADWVAVKIRWGLRVDTYERAALIRYADSCPATTLRVARL